MAETSLYYEQGERNSYPDFRMVNYAEGYEVKGLAYPGREASYDANSQVPTGSHNGRTIFYVFGRYPAKPDGNSYPVLDLVVCHGDFLNANHDYVHQNRSIKGFGSYGDLLIRNRKMYVAPTPFRLVRGVAHTNTLILPAHYEVDKDYKQVGELLRVETDTLLVSYKVDLTNHGLHPTTIPNPAAGKEHMFSAWRTKADSDEAVIMQKK